ncbi:acyl carrier protein [Limnoglobus roseus]|uniref:Acyl carrier protein n=1 Tax=Limnoglobus roseus TaxID=2598579 RepID=A0A5C1APN8_9BACT|nr:acyl carrier protein [Limnoglobus roseus]
MSDEQIRQKVIDIVCEHLAVNKDQVTDKTSFIEDIGADSLDIVELVMELEEEFDIQIPDDQAEKIKTVGEAVEHIKVAVKNKDKDGGAKA